MKKVIKFIILTLIITVPITAWGKDNKPVATQDAYFDVSTGHKYIKNSENTYTEYSKNGERFRKAVSNSLPLLVSGKNIRQMVPGSFLLYEKREKNEIQRQVLSVSTKHPEGWRAKEILISFKQFAHQENLGLGYSKEVKTILYDGRKAVATGSAYYDIATHHKYIKNPNTTYSEYSKKGKLLRKDVPSDLPLLTSGLYVFDLNPGDYIVYEKRQSGEIKALVLSAIETHPPGWYSKDSFSSVR
jgi:hypothetical protein